MLDQNVVPDGRSGAIQRCGTIERSVCSPWLYSGSTTVYLMQNFQQYLNTLMMVVTNVLVCVFKSFFHVKTMVKGYFFTYALFK